MKYLIYCFLFLLPVTVFSQKNKEKKPCNYYGCIDYGEAVYQKQSNIKHRVYRISKTMKSSEEMKFSYNKQGAQTMTGFTIINVGPHSSDKACQKEIEEQITELESKGFAKSKKEHAFPNITYVNFKPCK